jgi:leader peptidase (prepilin peptidase)/N-methyltransferase
MPVNQSKQMRSGEIATPQFLMEVTDDLDLSYIRLYGFLPMPMPIPIMLPFEITWQISLFIGFVLFAFLLGFLLERQMKKLWQKAYVLNVYLPIIAATLLFLRFGTSMASIKGLILFMMLLYASNSDLRTREVSDVISLMIAVTALIGITTANIPLMVLGAVCITVPQLIVVALKPNCYGGADIKIMAACSFLLGLERGFLGIITGLAVAIITTIITRLVKKKDMKEAFPIVPYLALGSFLAYLI